MPIHRCFNLTLDQCASISVAVADGDCAESDALTVLALDRGDERILATELPEMIRLAPNPNGG